MFTNSELKSYIREGKRHPRYRKTVDIYDHLRFHVDGYTYDHAKGDDNPYFHKLIDSYRPGEKDDVRKYRRENYSAITKRPCFKVINSLKKIVKSEEWSIDYSAVKPANSIAKGEELEVYIEKNVPHYNSVENWVFRYGLRAMITDPNAIIMVRPYVWETEGSEYLKPVPDLIHSPKVLDFVDGKKLVYISSEHEEFMHNGVKYPAMVVYAVLEGKVYRCVQTDNDLNFNIKIVYTYDQFPAFCVGFGEMCEVISGSPIYDSFISPMLPDLDRAARENSDLDASVVQHMYPLEWYYAGSECGSCNGTAKILKDGNPVICPTCEGTGSRVKSPFTDIILKPQTFGENPIPAPPAGFIGRDTEVIKLQDERIDNHIWNSLSALNMEFLADSPLNESGVAKEIDRDELNNFVYGVAYQLVEGVMHPIYERVSEYRYKEVLKNADQRKQILPSIMIPERFDLLSENTIVDQLAKVSQSGVDANVISEVQNDYIGKKFRNQPEVRKKLMTIMQMNPFPTAKKQEISDALMSRQVDQIDAILYLYMESFVERAMAMDPKFLDKDYKQKEAVLRKMAVEKAGQISGLESGEEIDLKGLATSENGTTDVDVEAEAKAKLKGTVGGVNGIISINQAVQDGTMTEASARLLLQEIYGFTPETASKLIQQKKAAVSE